MSLAREVGGLQGEETLRHAFGKLAENVHPVALGQVYRARTQIRMLSRKLLQLHMKADDLAIDSIVETLTEKLYSRDYIITRREARSIGLKVSEPEPKLEAAIAALYDEYEKDLELRQPFNPVITLNAAPGQGGQKQVKMAAERAYIESTARCDVYLTEQVLQTVPQGIQATQLHDGWKTI